MPNSDAYNEIGSKIVNRTRGIVGNTAVILPMMIRYSLCSNRYASLQAIWSFEDGVIFCDGPTGEEPTS